MSKLTIVTGFTAYDVRWSWESGFKIIIVVASDDFECVSVVIILTIHIRLG